MKGAKYPDEFIRKFGAQRFKMLIEGACSVTEYQMGVIRAKYDLGSTEQRGAYLQESADYLATVASTMERELYIGRLAEETDIPRDAIRESVNRALRRNLRKARKKEEESFESGRNFARAGHQADESAQDGLLACLFHHPDWRGNIIARIPENALSEAAAAIYQAILTAQLEDDGSLSAVGRRITPEQMSRLAGILARVSDGQLSITPEALEDYFRRMQGGRLQKEIRDSANLSMDEARALAEKIRQSKKV